MKLLNSISLNMLPPLAVMFVSPYEGEIKGLESHIGHADLARILGVEMRRDTVHLIDGEEAVVAQYVGPRLPEGTSVLPEGAQISLSLVSVCSWHRLQQHMEKGGNGWLPMPGSKLFFDKI